MDGYFQACVCSEDAPRRKPDPAPLRLALRQLRAKPAEAIYVGDSPQDMQMARRAGVRAIGVLGPFPTAKSLSAEKPELLLKSVRDLPKYVEKCVEETGQPRRYWTGTLGCVARQLARRSERRGCGIDVFEVGCANDQVDRLRILIFDFYFVIRLGVGRQPVLFLKILAVRLKHREREAPLLRLVGKLKFAETLHTMAKS